MKMEGIEEFDSVEIFNCTICDSDIGLNEDVENHSCFRAANFGDNNNDICTKETTKNLHWPRSAVLKLIDQWKENEDKFSSGTIRAKSLWQKVAAKLITEGFKPSWEQVDNKWKGLRRTYKKIKDNNNSTGRENQNWEFFDNLDEIFSKRPDTGPISKASTTRGFQERITSRPSTSEIDEEDGPIRQRRRRPQKNELLSELVQDQRDRHRDRMQAHDRLCNILEKIAEKIE